MAVQKYLLERWEQALRIEIIAKKQEVLRQAGGNEYIKSVKLQCWEELLKELDLYEEWNKALENKEKIKELEAQQREFMKNIKDEFGLETWQISGIDPMTFVTTSHTDSLVEDMKRDIVSQSINGQRYIDLCDLEKKISLHVLSANSSPDLQRVAENLLDKIEDI